MRDDHPGGESWIALDTLIPQGAPAPATPTSEGTEWGHRSDRATPNRSPNRPQKPMLSIDTSAITGPGGEERPSAAILDVAQNEQSLMGNWLPRERSHSTGGYQDADSDHTPQPEDTGTHRDAEATLLSPTRIPGIALGAVDSVLGPGLTVPVSPHRTKSSRSSRSPSRSSILSPHLSPGGQSSMGFSAGPSSPVALSPQNPSPVGHSPSHESVGISSWRTPSTTHLPPLNSNPTLSPRYRRLSPRLSYNSSALEMTAESPHTSPRQSPRSAAEVSSMRAPSRTHILLEVPDLPPLPPSDYAMSIASTGPASSLATGYRGYDPSVTGQSDVASFKPEPMEDPMGRTLFLFGPQHPLRRCLFRLLRSPWTHFTLVTLTGTQMVMIAIETVHQFKIDDQGNAVTEVPWIDYTYMALYALFTLHAIAQLIAFGAFTVRRLTLREMLSGSAELVWQSLRHMFMGGWGTAGSLTVGVEAEHHPDDNLDSKSRDGPEYEQLCFFRKSWNRVEALSITAFWVWTILQSVMNSMNPILLLISGLAHIRVLRLLDYIVYTRVVLQALKIALPLLQSVLLFIVFFLLIFSLTGLQSFNSSLRRKCVYEWTNENGVPQTYVSSQNCGSYYETNSTTKVPYLADGAPALRVKGYTCPQGSECVMLGGPQFPRGEMSFDNIFNSLELVYIIMSMNSYAPVMYNVMDSEYLVSCLFFITGILVLGMWLINLLVAVMVSSYTAVRDAAVSVEFAREWKSFFRTSDDAPGGIRAAVALKGRMGRLYSLAYPVFAVLAGLDVIFQALWFGKSGLQVWELVLCILFTFEIMTRFMVQRRPRRTFWRSMSNVFDLLLVIANIVTMCFWRVDQAYAWLTFFQLLRFYRFASAFPFTRRLWTQLLGNYRILVNLTIFHFFMTFLASLVVSKMLRGQFPAEQDGELQPESFYDLGTTFLNLYQVSSTENWTDILFFTTQNSTSSVAAACMGILLCLWLFFSSFLVLNLFIAVMSENLGASSGDTKRQQQVRRFVRDTLGLANDLDTSSVGPHVPVVGAFRQLLDKWRKRRESRPVVDEAVEREFVAEFLGKTAVGEGSGGPQLRPHQVSLYDTHPLATKVKEVARHLGTYFWRYPRDYYDFVEARTRPQTTAPEDYVSELYAYRLRLRAAVDSYRKQNPWFDRPLLLFGPKNRIRLWCQRLVDSSYGERASGVAPKQWVRAITQLFFVAATAAMVINTCINTPVYNLSHSSPHRWTGVRVADLVFGLIFLMEFLIKVIADGLHFSPNAFTHSPWNLIDFVALLAIWVTFVSDLVDSHVSRYLRGLLALRALRLISYRPRTEALFRAVFMRGLGNILGAAFIALAVLVPYSVWGTNLFAHRLQFCNDGNVNLLGQCVDEYSSQVFNEWNVLAPRSVQTQYLDFDTFGHALFTNFGVLSLEGWADVLQFVTSIVDGGKANPTNYASRLNGLYPVLFNYIGTVLIMTMFVAVVIRNYAEASGKAWLTHDQLLWIDLKRTLKVVRPHPLPPQYPAGSVRRYLLGQMLGTRSWYVSIEVWALGIVTVILLITYYPLPVAATNAYNLIVLACAVLLTCMAFLRLFIMKWRLFLHNLWNPAGLLGLVVLTVTTAVSESWGRAPEAVANVQQAAYIYTLLLWIPRIRRLHDLFLMATTAVRELSSLLMTWFTLFLTYAIAFNQSFGLTKIGPNTSQTKNFRTVPKALIVLFTMSTGEGWNQVLTDFRIRAPYCASTDSYSECGDDFLAYFLFSTWNIVSMYIFANLLISLIVEGFWYVHRRGPWSFTEGDIARFIAAWQELDPHGSGWIPLSDLDALLSRTTGYFSLSVYAHDPIWSVRAILNRMPSPRFADPYNVDVAALNRALEGFPATEMRRTRELYEMFRAHVNLIADQQRGIRFGRILRLFPLYRDLDPAQVLSLGEFLRLRIQLHEARMVVAASVVQRRWKHRCETKEHAERSQPENPFQTPDEVAALDSQNENIFEDADPFADNKSASSASVTSGTLTPT